MGQQLQVWKCLYLDSLRRNKQSQQHAALVPSIFAMWRLIGSLRAQCLLAVWASVYWLTLSSRCVLELDMLHHFARNGLNGFHVGPTISVAKPSTSLLLNDTYKSSALLWHNPLRLKKTKQDDFILWDVCQVLHINCVQLNATMWT